MDNDKGLDLSLALPCGSKSADTTPETDERTSKIVNDFKNFLNLGNNPAKFQENFFTSLPQTAENKRKSVFHEANNQEKQDTEPLSPDLSDKGKTSFISVNTDEGSTADNKEDGVESEAEGSFPRTISPLSQCEERSKTLQVLKEVHSKDNISSPLFPVQQFNALNVPYSITIEDSPAVGPSSASNYPRAGMIQSTNSTSPVNVPMTFGYSTIRVPTIGKESPWKMAVCPQSLRSPYGGRSISNSVPTQVNSPSSSEPPRPNTRPLTQPKPLAGQEGPSSNTGNNPKRYKADASPSEYPSIRPGIGVEVQFGGSGSFPSLPWVSTTVPGPNGKTVSGVTYKFNGTQVMIVCACHGTHMTPDEFVRHASEVRQPNSTSLASFTSSNPATSAKT